MSGRVRVFCQNCKQVVSSFHRGDKPAPYEGVDRWRSCPSCHVRGQFLTLDIAVQRGLLTSSAAEIWKGEK